MYPEHKVTIKQLSNITRLAKRRLAGEPIAYILGYKDFFGLRFQVNKNVLVPRPETEWLVERVTTIIPSDRKAQPIKILDLGTGSGAIVVSVAKTLQADGKSASSKQQADTTGQRFAFHASDVSGTALAVAKLNARKHKVKINFHKSDLFKEIKGQFDVIIANLPYVPLKNYESRIKNLEWEPKIALIDPVKDFDLYERFFRQVSQSGILRPTSTILLEMDPKTKPHIQKFAKKYLLGWKVKFFKDYNNLWRFAEIRIA